MNKTNIEWAKNPDGTPGYTWNPITGCLKGCDYCYARKLCNGRLRNRILGHTSGRGISPNINGTIYEYGVRYPGLNRDPFWPHFWTGRLYHPFLGEPKGIFTCSMGELFGDWIPKEWQDDIFRLIKLHPLNRYYLLTKQPQNLANFSPFPDNCWVGVSATNYEMFGKACELLEYPNVDAKFKYISIEPLLNWEYYWTPSYLVNMLKRAKINWVIIGAQTKPTIYPKVEWIKEITVACDKAGVKVFLKNSLDLLLGQNTDFKKWVGVDGEGHNLYGLRQEMPAERG